MKIEKGSQILWRYSEIETFMNSLEDLNIAMDEKMSKIKEQNKLLYESMSGSSKKAFYDSYFKMHATMIKVRIEMENLIKKSREGKNSVNMKDTDMANRIRQGWRHNDKQ